MTTHDLLETFAPEELHQDLKPFIENVGDFNMLRHPLVYCVPYTGHWNKLLNESYLRKQSFIRGVIEQKIVDTIVAERFVFTYERPYRFHALREISSKISNEQFGELFRSVWMDSENIWENNAIIDALLEEHIPVSESIMSEDERKLMDDLPQTFVIYRGHEANNPSGRSWTLSPAVAEWFSRRFSQRSIGVQRAWVDKSQVLAVYLGRNEFEVVVRNPQDVSSQSVEPLSRPDYLAEILGKVQNLRHPESHHGARHWERVERNVVALCKLTPNADVKVARLFAMLHDSQRVNDNEDPAHGSRAADYAKTALPPGLLTPAQMDTLCQACADHEWGKVTSDPTIGVCWDADRLDLLRVGIIPDPNLLSTEAGRSSIWRI